MNHTFFVNQFDRFNEVNDYLQEKVTLVLNLIIAHLRFWSINFEHLVHHFSDSAKRQEKILILRNLQRKSGTQYKELDFDSILLA